MLKRERIELTGHVLIDVLDAGLGDRDVRPAHSLDETNIGTNGDFVLDHEVDSLLEA